MGGEPLPCSSPSADAFNAAQREAIGFADGCLIVNAGPGTGKTRVLTERMRALKRQGARSILAITFTTKACEEIKKRLNDEGLDVYTFHALAARIMQDAGVPFAIADDAALSEKAGGREAADDLLLRLSTRRPLDAPQTELLRELRQAGVYPFEGLIVEGMELLEQACTHAWEHILVDEFQDINPLQYAFLKLLARPARSLMVIGDPHQAIYSFRGGNPQAFDDFLSDFPEARHIALTQTYRLHTVIARASNALIARESVVSPRAGHPIRLVKTPSPPRYIAREIEALLGGLSHRTVHRGKGSPPIPSSPSGERGRDRGEPFPEHYPPSAIAVICRTRSQTIPVMEALSEAGIPFDAAYGRPLAETHGIAQRLALLEGDFLPHLKGVGEKTLARIQAGDDPGGQIAERIRQAQTLLDSLPTALHARIQALEASPLFTLPPIDHEVFYQHAITFGDDLPGFLTFCRLQHDAPAGERVRVLTAHAAKGLEFSCVFITGRFPLPETPLWEERNLFYVAMTRAIDHLYICMDGQFATQIPPDLVQLHEEQIRPRTQQMTLFD